MTPPRGAPEYAVPATEQPALAAPQPPPPPPQETGLPSFLEEPARFGDAGVVDLSGMARLSYQSRSDTVTVAKQDFVTETELSTLIDYVDSIWRDYGAPEKVHGRTSRKTEQIRRDAMLHGLTLVSAPVRQRIWPHAASMPKMCGASAGATSSVPR